MPRKTPRIAVVGSINLDLTFRCQRLPRLGETFAGTGFQLGFGGKGANQAVMAARLGARVAMVGKIGQDTFGQQALANLHSQGVDTSHVTLDELRPTGVAGIFVDSRARNAIVVAPGANAALTPADVARAAPAIRSADVLLCQLETPLEATLAAFSLARQADVFTILNPAPGRPLPSELLRLTDLCAPNEAELEALARACPRDLPGLVRVARRLLRRGPRAVLVTLGERGGLLVERSQQTHWPAEPVDAVDSSGAGDVFLGCLSVYLAEGLPTELAARKANAVAALSVTRPGTQAAFPTRDETADFLQQRGFAERS